MSRKDGLSVEVVATSLRGSVAASMLSKYFLSFMSVLGLVVACVDVRTGVSVVAGSATSARRTLETALAMIAMAANAGT